MPAAELPTKLGLWHMLVEELAPRPGQGATVARMAANCAFVVAVAMIYQIPLPAYMAYAIFVISKDEAASTLLASVSATIAFTAAILLSLTFYTLDAAEPALRLPLMAASTFIGMYLVRAMSLGPIAFLTGFVLVLSQTLIEKIPSLEGLTRLILWLWVVVSVPAATTILINLVVGKRPADLAREMASKLLRDLASSLRTGNDEDSMKSQAEAIELLTVRQRANLFDRDLRQSAARDAELIEIVVELLTQRILLSPDAPRNARFEFAEILDVCAAAVQQGKKLAAADFPHPAPEAVTVDPVVTAMRNTLNRLVAGLVEKTEFPRSNVMPRRKSLFVSDAVTNPDYVRYAIKTTVAVMAAYIIYTGLDWPGISTSVTTCFFVALGTYGETMQKLTLRLSGAALGGLAGCIALVYIVPQMTDIGQLCLLIAGVATIGGWVATCSERLSYGGMQFVFAFFLGVLQGYEPPTDLTELRDRVVGVFLGNFLISVVFSVLWPVSAIEGVSRAVTAALRAIASLIETEGSSDPIRKLAVVRSLSEAHRLKSFFPFELGMSPDKRTIVLPPANLHRLAAAAFVVSNQSIPSAPAYRTALHKLDEEIRSELIAAFSAPLPGTTDEITGSDDQDLAGMQINVDISAVPAINARLLLRREIRHAFASRA